VVLDGQRDACARQVGADGGERALDGADVVGSRHHPQRAAADLTRDLDAAAQDGDVDAACAHLHGHAQLRCARSKCRTLARRQRIKRHVLAELNDLRALRGTASQNVLRRSQQILAARNIGRSVPIRKAGNSQAHDVNLPVNGPAQAVRVCPQ